MKSFSVLASLIVLLLVVVLASASPPTATANDLINISVSDANGGTAVSPASPAYATIHATINPVANPVDFEIAYGLRY